MEAYNDQYFQGLKIKSAMNTVKIVVEVEGGNVIAVYASTPNVEVVILDYDNYQHGQEMTEEEEHAQRQAINKELFKVY